MSNQVTVRALFEEGTSQENYPLQAITQPPTDPEDIDEYTDEQMVVVQVNAKARNLLYNAIGGEEYEKILICDTTKEIWDKLEVTYEGTRKVKETRINMLVHDYELFQMKEGESIEKMFARFSKIIGYLKAFVALESQDLSKLSYDELRGDLITFEKTHLKNHEEKKKIVTFKTTTKGHEDDINDDPEALEEKIIMVSRNINGLMRRYRNTKKERMSSRRTRKYNEQDKNDGKCFECERGFSKNKSFGSWSDEDSSEHEEISNMCFMTILENDMNKYSGCWTEKDTSDDKSKENTKNCFMDILDLTLKESQKMLNELKRLNRKEKKRTGNSNLNHSSVKSNQVIYKSTEKGYARTESISTNTRDRSKTGSIIVCHYCNKVGHKYSFVDFEHHRKIRKGKWYLDNACSSHMISDKNLFKEVTKINGETVKFGSDSREKIFGIDTVPFNNNCDITEVYLVDGLNYNLLSISQLCDSGYEVKFKKTGCAIGDESGKTILPEKMYENVYILDGIENLDSHIYLASISDDPWLWHKKLGHASMHLIEKLS
ncbi:uncharacterized protein [Nicotiana tomentosiformis]|uniref:uncharacterized protein n=1 Tax=Nicotiana tomentosiformis TaxID=4098 RepID=UPI00388C3E17